MGYFGSKATSGLCQLLLGLGSELSHAAFNFAVFCCPEVSQRAGFSGFGAVRSRRRRRYRRVGGLFSGCGRRPGIGRTPLALRAAAASRRSSRRRVSARLSRRLAKITASAMLSRLARFAGQAGVLAEDAVSVVHVFHGPRPQQFLWRRVLRIELMYRCSRCRSLRRWRSFPAARGSMRAICRGS